MFEWQSISDLRQQQSPDVQACRWTKALDIPNKGVKTTHLNSEDMNKSVWLVLILGTGHEKLSSDGITDNVVELRTHGCVSKI